MTDTETIAVLDPTSNEVVTMNAESLGAMLSRFSMAGDILNRIEEVITERQGSDEDTLPQFGAVQVMQGYWEGMRDAVRYLMTGQPPEL